MNTQALSGLLVTVAAILWIVVFIPSWFHTNENREEFRAARSQRKRIERGIRSQRIHKTASKADEVAQRLFKVSLLRKLSVVGLLGSLSGIVYVAFNFASLWLSGILALGVFVVSIRFARRTRMLKQELLASAVRSRSSLSAKLSDFYSKELQESMRQESSKLWQPVDLPAPMHVLNKVGSLETPNLASVSQISDVRKTDEARDSSSMRGTQLDEILRKRRAI